MRGKRRDIEHGRALLRCIFGRGVRGRYLYAAGAAAAATSMNGFATFGYLLTRAATAIAVLCTVFV